MKTTRLMAAIIAGCMVLCGCGGTAETDTVGVVSETGGIAKTEVQVKKDSTMPSKYNPVQVNRDALSYFNPDKSTSGAEIISCAQERLDKAGKTEGFSQNTALPTPDSSVYGVTLIKNVKNAYVYSVSEDGSFNDVDLYGSILAYVSVLTDRGFGFRPYAGSGGSVYDGDTEIAKIVLFSDENYGYTINMTLLGS